MKYPPVILFLFSISFSSTAQEPPPRDEENTVYDRLVIEEQPQFPGGEAAMMKYLKENIEYPAVEKENGIQGKVFISFIIEKDGAVSNVTAVKGVSGGPDLEKEAVRVISTMPNWMPGKQNGKPVRVKFTIPISFTLDEGKKSALSGSPPQFPGGETELDKFISNNLQYPKKARKKRTEGEVEVLLMIQADGSVTKPSVTKKLGYGCDEEALRIAGLFPKFIPAKDRNGQACAAIYKVKINFKL
jgi:TonB family protein